MLQKQGHATASFARTHPLDMPAEFAQYFPPNIITDKVRFSWETFRTVIEMFYSKSARNGLAKLLSHYEPDIAHVHNIYGRLTTAVLDLLSERKIPVVMTLHDYKLACPSYLFLRNGQVCENCKGGRFYRAIWNHCHKESYAASAFVALEAYMNALLQKYRKKTHLLISPSQFLKNKLTQYGWPEDKIRHIRNFLDLRQLKPRYSRGKYLLYIGRLSEEKGIQSLIMAFSGLANPRIGLKITGDGPLRHTLESMVQDNPNIDFTGYLKGKSLQEVTSNALAVVIPSLCYENAPLSVLEAMAFGKPVIGARIGGIPEMIQENITGFLFKSGDSESMKQVLDRIISMPDDKIESMGIAARKVVEKNYSIESHYIGLMDVYNEILDQSVEL
jgi:glycosyltransferase involved in cell wall biosynthesis